MRSQAAAGQCQALLSPADGEQQGRVKAQEEQGQAEAHTVSKSSGGPPQMGSANDHFGRKEQQEEEELPWVPVHCQAGFESGGASRPPEAPVHPHLLGVAGVVPGQAPCLPGPGTPELRVRPPQVGGLADEELEPWPSLF